MFCLCCLVYVGVIVDVDANCDIVFVDFVVDVGDDDCCYVLIGIIG